MPCSSPLSAFQHVESGQIHFKPTGTPDRYRALQLPCGKCTRCYLERSRQWAVRQVHEAQIHKDNCFLTLTLNNEAIDEFGWGLQPKLYTDFAKRMRSKLGKFSYYMCGEYGELKLRPHFHANIFGLTFNDAFPHKKTRNGDQLYQSDTLDELWKWGDAWIAELNFDTAAYVARYMMNKPTTEKEREKRYQRVDGDTGEIIQVKPEYSRMSLNPAIAKRWIQEFSSDVYPNDFVISKTRQAKPPRYYDKWYEEKDERGFENIKETRRALANLRQDDNTPQRLRVKEDIAKALLQRKARTL